MEGAALASPILKTVVLAYCRIRASHWVAEAAPAAVSPCFSLAYTLIDLPAFVPTTL